MSADLHLLGAIDIALIVLLLVALFGYIEIVRQSGSTAAHPCVYSKHHFSLAGCYRRSALTLTY